MRWNWACEKMKASAIGTASKARFILHDNTLNLFRYLLSQHEAPRAHTPSVANPQLSILVLSPSACPYPCLLPLIACMVACFVLSLPCAFLHTLPGWMTALFVLVRACVRPQGRRRARAWPGLARRRVESTTRIEIEVD